MAKRVLMVLTSHDMMGISGKKTGNWFDEVATPYYKFKEAGFDVTLASPKGGPAPLDPFSFDGHVHDGEYAEVSEGSAGPAHAGEHAPVQRHQHRRLRRSVFPGRLRPALGSGQRLEGDPGNRRLDPGEDPGCHGVSCTGDPARCQEFRGRAAVKGKDVTGFTGAEDEEIDLSRHLLFSLEKALTANGGNFRRSNKNWLPNVVEDGALLTGQNPASAAPIADALVARLR